MKNKYCKYCWPTKRRTHFFLHLDYYCNKLTYFFKPIDWFLKRIGKDHSFFWMTFLEILSIFKIVKFVPDPDQSKLFNRSLIFFKEAKKRNLQIEAVRFLGKYINEFRFTHQGKKYYYSEIPLTLFEDLESKMDDKYFFKKILEKNNLPSARGRVFTKQNKAIEYGVDIGFPLVVKPRNGSLSHHACYPIKSKQKLIEAVKIANQYKPAFIVERYISGDLFRASVVGKENIFICKKEKANVVGDGVSTIEELINLKNKNPNRGAANQKNFTLHQIVIDKDLKNKLKKEGLNLRSVPKKGKKIILSDKIILSKGCDVINVKKEAHSENKKLFLKIAKILDSDLVGFDFICSDISKSYKEQGLAILEANSLPFIDMHQFPSKGEKESVAEIVWDLVLKNI